MKNLNCPFCNDNQPGIECDSYGSLFIECSNCGARSETGYSEIECWKNWNTRPQPDEKQAYLQGFNDAKVIVINQIKIMEP
jgi:hypothetical protein